MPSWTPNWNPVEIDEAGLLDAIADCSAAVATIEDGHAALGPFVATAQEQWEGPARIDFDDHYAGFERQIGGVISQLRQAALGYQREIAEAHEEQGRRSAQQDQWRRELADEQAREVAAREIAARQANQTSHEPTTTFGPPVPTTTTAPPYAAWSW